MKSRETIKIISGGQSGVDRAALDVAIYLNIAHGGVCPKGRLAEDGIIPKKYILKESNHSNPLFRTRQNVIDADATLIFCRSEESYFLDGTGATIMFCKTHGKNFFTHMPSNGYADERCVEWLNKITPSPMSINIAGPRSSNWDMSYQYTYAHLMKVLTSYFNQ